MTDSDRAYPLIALVNLLTACVALAACVDGSELFVVTAQPDGGLLLITSAAAVTGAVCGAAIGTGYIYLWRSVALCSATGAIVGVVTLAAIVAPPQLAPAVVAIFLPAATVGIFRSLSDGYIARKCDRSVRFTLVSGQDRLCLWHWHFPHDCDP